MSWTDKRSRMARLKRIQRQIDAEYGRTPTYIVYRNGRPHKPRTAVRRQEKQLKESLIIVITLAIAGMCAGWGIGG